MTAKEQYLTALKDDRSLLQELLSSPTMSRAVPRSMRAWSRAKTPSRPALPPASTIRPESGAASRAGPFVAGSTSSDLIGRKRTEAVQGAGLTSALRSFAISLPSRNLTLKMTPSGIRQV